MVQGLAHKAGLLLLACVAATLFVASSVWLLWHGEAVRYDAARRAAVTTHLDDIRLALQSALDARLAFLRAVAASAASDPDITPARFDAFAAALMQGTTDIRSLQLARDAVVSHVYPLAGNAGVLGLDLARDLPYAQRAALAATLDAGRTVVSGPVALLQGGRGFIARMPVMAATAPGAPLRRWGLAAIVIDVDAFFRETGLPGNGDVQVAVRDQGQDGGCVLVFGEPAVFPREPVTTSMA
ncbi:MAG TPA: CHASE domain-containing protein, partial [Solidesulfovibrio magneticus]|nr:CHASE domain-containing protein [Solidesulfovibrio magneticus]